LARFFNKLLVNGLVRKAPARPLPLSTTALAVASTARAAHELGSSAFSTPPPSFKQGQKKNLATYNDYRKAVQIRA
jgi:hypothetical protein